MSSYQLTTQARKALTDLLAMREIPDGFLIIYVTPASCVTPEPSPTLTPIDGASRRPDVAAGICHLVKEFPVPMTNDEKLYGPQSGRAVSVVVDVSSEAQLADVCNLATRSACSYAILIGSTPGTAEVMVCGELSQLQLFYERVRLLLGAVDAVDAEC